MNAMKTFKEQVADMETLASCGRFIIETVENALEVLAQNDIEARVHIGADGTTADLVIVLPEGLQLPAPKSMRDVFRHAMEAAQPKPETTPEPSEPAPTPKPTKSAATTPKAELVTGPWSEDEIQEFISLTLDGYLPKDIAARLNRKPKDVHNKKTRIRDRIEAAQIARDNPVRRPAVAPKNGPASTATPATPPPSAVAAPAAPQAAPRATGAAATDKDANLGQLSLDERKIDAHLNALGYADSWSAERDYNLVKAMARGDGAAFVGELLDENKDTIIARWKALNTDPASIDHQTRLVRVLKLRAGA